jgi:phospholipid/cholesterol/gamma-HCH transport system substrate-binding protein
VSLGGQLRRYVAPLAAIVAMAIVALAVAFYVLAHQRVRFPWQDRYTVRIELASAQALTPGQGQTVNVAGVAVGSIKSVRLRDGVAVVDAEMDPHKLDHVYANATAVVRPKTGLQDMVVALDPGGKPARALPDGGTIPVSQTQPQVNLDEVLSTLDADTRDYLRILVTAGADGLRGQGENLRALFKASAPTLRLTREATQAIADRREKVRRLIHNLRALSEATAGKDDRLAQLVDASDTALRAIDRQEAALRLGLSKLPSTIDTARGALAAAKPLSEELGPTLRKLLPSTRGLSPALRAAKPLLREGTPQLGDVLRLVRTSRPVVRDLKPATSDLATQTPDLTKSFSVLRYVTNELAYNPPGSEEGYLFWFAWFAHNSASLLSSGDAHGIFWRGQTMTSCSTLTTLAEAGQGNGALSTLLKALPCPGKPQNAATQTPPGGGR